MGEVAGTTEVAGSAGAVEVAEVLVAKARAEAPGGARVVGVGDALVGDAGADEVSGVDAVVAAARGALGGRTVWHINTTAVGGGVAELLRSAMPRHAAAGLRARWLVVRAGQEFFGITKQLHHLFHGSFGSGRALGDAEFAVYERTTREAAGKALPYMTPGDLVLLHDPQTLGMAPALGRAGMRVAWRSHIGTSSPGRPAVAAAWEFLEPFVAAPLRCVFSLPQYVPPGLGGPDSSGGVSGVSGSGGVGSPDLDGADSRRAVIIAPSIDEASEKCRAMEEGEAEGILASIGLVGAAEWRGAEGAEESTTVGQLRRKSGELGTYEAATGAYLERRVRIWQEQPLPPDVATVLQLCRWDPLKDMVGTLTAFVRHIAPVSGAHLVLAGPDPADIADDPENLAVFEAVLRDRAALPVEVRRRVHLVALGLADDAVELRANALVVNALQRRATVVAQKSVEEGFGLAVAEAMWKSRPVVASSVGGIRMQVAHGVNGLLVDDPADLRGFGREVVRLLEDASLREKLGRAAHDHCALHYLAWREFRDHALLYLDLCGTGLSGTDQGGAEGAVGR